MVKVKPKLKTAFSPELVHLYDLKGMTVVVIDIFRATSTICAALDNGAEAVIPIKTVDECIAMGERYPQLMTGGERNGQAIKELDGNNSPLEYTPETIKGRMLALTTTNGTRLMHTVKDAQEILIGSFLNIDRLCEYLIEKGEDVLLACAGWRKCANLEDSLFAGAVVDKIAAYFDSCCDSSIMARVIYQQALQEESIHHFLKAGSHFKRLASFSHDRDMHYCCRLNLHPVLPVFKFPFLIKKGAKVPSLDYVPDLAI